MGAWYFIQIVYWPSSSLIAETPGTLPLLENSVGADYIYSSPLARAAESAKIIANEIGFPEDCIIYDEGVQEWNGGEIQGEYIGSKNGSVIDRSSGILLPELEEKCPAAWHAWRVERNPHYEFNGGESFAQRLTYSDTLSSIPIFPLTDVSVLSVQSKH